MKANELKSLKKGYFFSCKIPKPHSHYKMAMTKGFYFPGTRSQARHFLKNGNLGLLNFDDVERVEAMLNKHGYEGNYKYTKNKKFIFLKNKEDLNNALRKEFNLPKTETVSIPPPVRTTHLLAPLDSLIQLDFFKNNLKLIQWVINVLNMYERLDKMKPYDAYCRFISLIHYYIGNQNDTDLIHLKNHLNYSSVDDLVKDLNNLLNLKFDDVFVKI